MNGLKNDIAIYGAGGFGREIACLLQAINSEKPVWNLIGFFDDGKAKGTAVSHFGKVIGNVDDLNMYNKELSVVIAIGEAIIVRRIINNITNCKIDFPNIIAPNLKKCDPKTLSIGKDNIIQSSCVMSCDVTIGDFNIFDGSVVLGHDVKVGNFNVFMPATRISGEVIIGNNNFFGVGAIVLQQKIIGNDVRVGAGSVLMTKPKDGGVYIGNPAKRFEY